MTQLFLVYVKPEDIYAALEWRSVAVLKLQLGELDRFLFSRIFAPLIAFAEWKQVDDFLSYVISETKFVPAEWFNSSGVVSPFVFIQDSVAVDFKSPNLIEFYSLIFPDSEFLGLKDLRYLTSLGFDEDICLKALLKFAGDCEKCVEFLYDSKNEEYLKTWSRDSLKLNDLSNVERGRLSDSDLIFLDVLKINSKSLKNLTSKFETQSPYQTVLTIILELIQVFPNGTSPNIFLSFIMHLSTDIQADFELCLLSSIRIFLLFCYDKIRN